MSSITDILDSLGIDYRVNGDEVKTSCPICGNSNYKLWLNEKHKIGHCFRCDAKGTAQWFLFKHGATKLIQPKLNWQVDIKLESKHEEILLPLEAQRIYGGNVSISSLEALEFLTKKRRLTEDEIIAYDIHYCPYGKLLGNVIFPIYDADHKLIAWQARRYKYQGQKSYNPPGCGMNFYGLDKLLPDDNKIVLVEGPFDTIHVNRVLRKYKKGFACLGLMGHSLSDYHLAYLQYKIKPQTVYLMLDSDVNEEEIAIGVRLKKAGINIHVCQLQDKDPDELDESILIIDIDYARNIIELDTLHFM